MAALLPKGPEELQHWVADLGARLLDPSIHHLLPPLAGVRIDRPAETFTELVAARSAARDEQDVLALFTLAHAGVRIAHAVTSPWYFSFTRELARRARWAASWQASRRRLAPGEADTVRGEFRALLARQFDLSEGFSVHEILQTHAIVEGLQAAMAHPAPLALYRLAVELYRTSPQSLRLLSHLVEQFGVEVAVPLAPRLCAVALRFPYPSIALSDLIASVERARNRIDKLMARSATRFFRACRLDPEAAARSTRQDALDAPFLETDAWGESMRLYFDRYEAIADVEGRLQAMTHPLRPHAADAAVLACPLFLPTWAIYPDGQTADLRPQAGDLTGYARWVTDALDLLDGLAWLCAADATAG